jgi:hypothetical protein
MSAGASEMVPVELYAGPLDGLQTAVKVQPDFGDRWLFEHRAEGWITRVSYKPGHRTMRSGRRWVLVFDCVVASQRAEGGES